ncbi:MAG TPA: hypothetical protein VK155_05685 [Bacteroidales bacterium]|nr:hypothetical protein [Bacteroidales bacterium]
MNNLHLRKYFLLLLIPVFLLGSCKTALFSRTSTRKVERGMSGPNRKAVKMKEAPGVRRAKKTQQKKQEKQDRDYDKFVKKSRKHTFEIQSDDVKARMKQNDADRKTREKIKSRKAHQATKKAGRKYN